MKKIIFIFLILILSFAVFKCCPRKIDFLEDGEYTRFYNAEMKQKYPELKNIENITPYLTAFLASPYEYRRNDEGLIGVYDNIKQKMIIPQKYREIKACNGMYSMFFNAKDKETKKIIDYNGNVVFSSDYDEFDCEYNSWGGVKTKNNGKYGMVFYDGKEVLKPKYDSIEMQEHKEYSGGYYYIVRTGNRYGVFDNRGRKVIPLRKIVLHSLNGNYFIIENNNNKKGIIDTKSNIIVKPEYNTIIYRTSIETKPYFVMCKDDDICSVKDEEGKIILKDVKGPDIMQVTEKYYAIGSYKFGFDIIDKDGNKINKEKYKYLNLEEIRKSLELL